MFAPISGFPNYTYASYPNDFIKIRDSIINRNKILSIQKMNNSSRIITEYEIVIILEGNNKIILHYEKIKERDKEFDEIWNNCFMSQGE